MKIEKLKPGMTVYDVHSQKMGNTNIRSMGTWTVVVKEVDIANNRVLASWNTNTPKWCYEKQWSKWREKKPMMIKSVFGSYRIATRAEQKAAKESAA